MMGMQSHTLTTAPKHRLFVAVPLFAACVMVSIVAGVHARGELLHSAASDALIVVDAAEGSAVSQSGSVVDVQEGTAMIASRGMVQSAVGSWQLQGWNGAFDVSTQTDAFTIAALTTPVAVHAGSQEYIVPVGMQVRLRTDSSTQQLVPNILALPAHYMRDRLPRAHTLQEQADLAASANTDSLPLAVQLADAADSGQDALLLPTFVNDQTSKAIAAFHPALRDHVWVQFDVQLAQDPIALLMLLPTSDRLAVALAPLAVEAWGERWHQRFTESQNLPVDALLSELSTTLHKLHDDGYPDRARRYAEALLTAAQNVDMSPDTRASLTALTNGPVPVIEPIVVFSSAASSSESSASSDSSVDLLPPTKNRLASLNAMYTSQTSLAQQGSNVVVQGIVIPANGKDLLLNFTYDPVADSVTARDGQILTYPVNLEQFVQWAAE